jgi:transposase
MARVEGFGRSQAFPLPPDPRDRVPDDGLARVVAAAVERVEISAFKVDRRGTGKGMDHPRLMPASPIYGYADGIVSSRRLERATYGDVAVRFITANSRPDRATIATLPRGHQQAIARAFAEVPLMAREVGPLRLGTVSLDGTRMDANASKIRSLRYDRTRKLRARLEAEGDAALRAAQDRTFDGDDADGDDTNGRADGEHDGRAAPAEVRPPPERRTNLTDPDGGLVRNTRRHEFRRACDAGHGRPQRRAARLPLTTAARPRRAAAPAVEGTLAPGQAGQAPDRGGQGRVRPTNMDRRARLRHPQVRPRRHPLSPPRPRQGEIRMAGARPRGRLRAPARARRGLTLPAAHRRPRAGFSVLTNPTGHQLGAHRARRRKGSPCPTSTVCTTSPRSPPTRAATWRSGATCSDCASSRRR